MTEEINPVSKARIISDSLTEDEILQIKLLEILTRNLTIEEINKLYENLKI
mgnify:CR=1 FL=1|tara:strand:- start:376 stop:528 length:153 start_codon:yes stop_codon:yes gene_type:complete